MNQTQLPTKSIAVTKPSMQEPNPVTNNISAAAKPTNPSRPSHHQIEPHKPSMMLMEIFGEVSRFDFESMGFDFESVIMMIFFPRWSLSAGQTRASNRKPRHWKRVRLLQAKKDKVEKVNRDLKVMIGELSRERDSLRGEIGQLEEELKEKEEIRSELEICRERIEVFESEKKERDDFLLKILDSIKLVKENLVRIVEFLDDEKVIERETSEIWGEITSLKTLASEAESKVFEFKESKNKEKRELENSVVSLTEENCDINSILRIALVEKEAVEKSLNRLKGNNSEHQKRVALLQIVQRVGFGFMMGGGSNEHQSHESLGANATVPSSNKSDSSECEEDVDDFGFFLVGE